MRKNCLFSGLQGNCEHLFFRICYTVSVLFSLFYSSFTYSVLQSLLSHPHTTQLKKNTLSVILQEKTHINMILWVWELFSSCLCFYVEVSLSHLLFHFSLKKKKKKTVEWLRLQSLLYHDQDSESAVSPCISPHTLIQRFSIECRQTFIFLTQTHTPPSSLKPLSHWQTLESLCRDWGQGALF